MSSRGGGSPNGPHESVGSDGEVGCQSDTIFEMIYASITIAI